MNFFSYKLDHDYGLAPNPFGGHCSLAVCKPTIRNNKKLELDDWIFGTGSKQLKKNHHLIFAMKVKERLKLEDYWSDGRFQYKKPILNGSLVQMYGDNFYHIDAKGNWIQEPSAHSIIDSKEHFENDISGKFVLLSTEFYYFGEKAPLIPKEYRDVCNEGRNMKSTRLDQENAIFFLNWLKNNFKTGINGDPINWKDYAADHNQVNLKL